MDEEYYHGIFDYETIRNGSSFIPEQYADVFDKNENETTIQTGRIITLLSLMTSVIGCIGNLLICYVIIYNKNMHTIINMYLFNLAVSDFIQLVTFSFGAIYSIVFSSSSRVPYLKIIFKLVRSLYSVASLASILTTLAVTTDRFIAVCYPFIERKMSSKGRTLKIIIMLWIFSTVYEAGYATFPRLCDSRKQLHCNAWQLIRSTEVCTVLFFFIPMIIHVILYSFIGYHIWGSSNLTYSSSNQNQNRKGKLVLRRHFKMSVAVVVELVVCWGPMHFIIFLNKYHLLDHIPTVRKTLMIYSIVIYLLSTIINPIIYSIMSTKFRMAFKNLLCTSNSSFCIKPQKKNTFQSGTEHYTV